MSTTPLKIKPCKSCFNQRPQILTVKDKSRVVCSCGMMTRLVEIHQAVRIWNREDQVEEKDNVLC